MENLSNECFAYPEKRLYPIHTKQAALESWKEFSADLDNYSMDRIHLIANNFIKTAKLHNITYEMPEEQPVHAEVEVLTDDDGTSVQLSKIASVEDVQTAVDTLQNSRGQLKAPFIRKVAQYLYKQADEQDLQGECMIKLARFAGLGLAEPEEMIVEFRKRGALIDMPQQVASEFYKIYRDFENLDNKDGMMKLATQMCDVFSQIDGLFKLERYYGNQLQAPEDICFKVGIQDLIDEASDYLTVPSTGTVLSKKALLENKKQISSYLNEKYGEELKSDEEMLSKVASLSESGIKALLEVLD